VARDRKFAVAAIQSVALKQLNGREDAANEISAVALSGYVHNNLQSELLRIAHQLDSTAQEEKETSPEPILDELYAALNRTIADVQSIQLNGFDRIQRLPKAWEGIATIELHMDVDRQINGEKENSLSGLLEELITNSIRYGEADQISISIKQVDENIVVAFKHDGRGVIEEGSGLGSIWLSHLAFKGPNILRKKGQTLIEFSI
jgi:signal transduction histidine kinase